MIRERAQLRQAELQKRKLDEEMEILERQQAARMEREHRAEVWRKVKHRKKLIEMKRSKEAAAKVAKFRRIKLGLEDFSSSSSSEGEEMEWEDGEWGNDDDHYNNDDGEGAAFGGEDSKEQRADKLGESLDQHIRSRVQNEISARVNTIVLSRMEQSLQAEAQEREKKLARERRYSNARKKTGSRGRSSSSRGSGTKRRQSKSLRSNSRQSSRRRRQRPGRGGRGADDLDYDNEHDGDHLYDESSFTVRPKSREMTAPSPGLFPRGPLPSRESAYGGVGADRESLTRERERFRGLSRESAYGPRPGLPPLARPSSTASDLGSPSPTSRTRSRSRSRGKSRESTSAGGVRSRVGSSSGRPRSRAAPSPVLHFVATEGVDDETASSFPAAIHVTSSPFTIGRSTRCDATLDSVLYPKMLSKRHATLYVHRDGLGGCSVEICDKNSTNGTFSSGERVRALRQSVSNGEIIRFGHQGNLTQPRSEVVYMLQIPTAATAATAATTAGRSGLGSAADYKPPEQVLPEVATIRPMSRQNPQRAALSMLSEMFPTDVPWVVEKTNVHAHDFLSSRILK